MASGEAIGTTLHASLPIWSARQQWLVDHLRVRGHLVLDEGAVRAISRAGKSLLPVGVTAVNGDFERGDVVACLDSEGQEWARGLVNYSSSEVRRIMRQPSYRIAELLGVPNEPELMHRDNLAVLRRS